MLDSIRFKNVKSFKDNVYMGVGSPVSVICGNNASGKSNVYYAFKKMSEYVTDSFNFGGVGYRNVPAPFILSKQSVKSNSIFAMYFSIPSDTDKFRYEYEFSVDQNGTIRKERLTVHDELDGRYITIINRDDTYIDDVYINDPPSLSRDDVTNINTALEKEVLALSMGSKLKVDICKKVRNWFAGNVFIDQNDLQYDNGLVPKNMLPDGFTSDPNISQNVVEFMTSFGFDIQTVSAIEWEDDQYVVKVGHSVGSDKIEYVSLFNESDGFNKLFLLYKHISKVLQTGNVLFVDDLGVDLDNTALKHIVDMFLDSNINKNGAQLIFTSREASATVNKNFKPNVILVAERKSNGVSTLKHTKG